MKIKLKKNNITLPNTWKQCGVSFDQWKKLQSGEEIEVESAPESIMNLVEVKSDTSTKKKKGSK